ncbi:DUF1810 domain-containing protein [Xinfangfangia pollutisoli]|uniref:DUF1810 domain-containing protein n=1 Tax=Xinfangfangia pollutisoli TaxID=2865960 RepID=UPI001CD56F17|nr:DUF1810 domain-containing protein [Xinfangfangia pollutisoli]
MSARRKPVPQTEGLERFTIAQAAIWPGPLAEIRTGRKTGHWMWFVWPQLRGLGLSPAAQRYGIAGRAEAAAYLAHPVLGPRLAEISRVMLAHRAKPAAEILGPIDAQKLQSSMTLFASVPGADPIFAQLLATFFDRGPCERTRAMLTLPR